MAKGKPNMSDPTTAIKKHTRRSIKFILSVTIISSIATLLTGCQQKLGLLSPRGIIAHDERTLFFDALALMLVVVLPVIIMSFAFAYRYRESHKTAHYRPDWSHNSFLELFWWGIPIVIIVALGILTWKKTHQLDPYRALNMPGKPLLVQAVALRWKWLFIYPEQNLATVNYVELPTNRPIEFWITADAPMSAFFIPRLGSQIYAMAGMRTRLHLYTSQPGVYEGLNTQFNGEGFSDMHFKAHVVNKKHFDQWVKQMKAPTQGAKKLTIPAYQQIVKPTIAAPPIFYASVQPGLFKRIMAQYTQPNKRLH
jgi:cytochrome o ubiquinol oxidase subunit II